MTRQVPRDYTKQDYLLQLKEIQEKINLEKVKFGRLEEANNTYEEGLKRKKEKWELKEVLSKDSVKKASKKVIELKDEDIKLKKDINKKELIIEKLNKDIDKNDWLLDKVESKVIDAKEELKGVKQHSQDIQIRTEKELQVARKRFKDFELKDYRFDSRKRELDSLDEELKEKLKNIDVKERELLSKEKVLEKYSQRVKLEFNNKFPSEEIKYI